MTGICKFCGKEIRRSREGFWSARAQDDPALWYCDADPSDEKRHEPAADMDADSGRDYLSGPRKAVAAHLVTEHGFDPVQADALLGQIGPGQTAEVGNLRIHRAGKTGQYGVQVGES